MWKYTQLHTDMDMFIHMHLRVPRYTNTTHASTNIHTHTHTHTDMYFYMFTNVYTLTQKPTIQYTDMSSHTDLTQIHINIHVHI